MVELDYSHLIYAKQRASSFKSTIRRESFYIQKGNGKALSYRGNYPGDYAVFEATHPRLKLFQGTKIKVRKK